MYRATKKCGFYSLIPHIITGGNFLNYKGHAMKTDGNIYVIATQRNEKNITAGDFSKC